jgi:hypothetical protein
MKVLIPAGAQYSLPARSAVAVELAVAEVCISATESQEELYLAARAVEFHGNVVAEAPIGLMTAPR